MGIIVNNPTSATLLDNSVTTAKIADGAVTPAKLSAAVVGVNYIINSDFKVAQLATSASITAGNSIPTASTGYPVCDCWFAYSTGANSTLSQVQGTPKRLQLQTNANTTGCGVGQRIESVDSSDLATKTVTLSFECSHNNLTLLTVTASHPTTSADTFGTIATPTKTQISTTTISITSTLTRYSWTFTCPQNAEKGIEILFTFGSNSLAGTFQLANVKLEQSTTATAFIPTIYAEELWKCQRYFSIIPSASYGYPSPGASYAFMQFYYTPRPMRVSPILSKSYTAQTNVTSVNPSIISSYFFNDYIVAAGANNISWTFTANCFAYIP